MIFIRELLQLGQIQRPFQSTQIINRQIGTQRDRGRVLKKEERTKRVCHWTMDERLSEAESRAITAFVPLCAR